ncbi:MAG: ABC transporter permease subunit [Anaerolineae bacterium]|nr:ABC transporter permease subunit [Anaerolineae bacterium]
MDTHPSKLRWLPALVYGLVVLGPCVALARPEGLPLADWPALIVPTGRRLTLWLRSIGLASGVAAGGMGLGFLMALWLQRRRESRWAGWRWLFALLAPLPPMTHAMAWSWLLAQINIALQHAGLSALPATGWLVAGWVQIVWLAPLATGFSLIALDSVPHELTEAAHLLQPDTPTLTKIILPLAAPLLLAGGGLLFLLSLVDYGIPSIFQVNVFALDIFADFSVHGQPGRALLVAMPLLAATAAAIIFSQSRLRSAALDPPRHQPRSANADAWPAWLRALINGAQVVMLLAVTVPTVSLVTQIGSWEKLHTAVSTGAVEIGYSFQVALLASLLSLPLAITAAQGALQDKGMRISSDRRTPVRLGVWTSKAWWLAITIPMALPGPLVGIGLIGLWNHPTIAALSIYGSGFMPVLAALARYTPLGALVMIAALRRLNPELIDAARLLQANRIRRWLLIRLPLLAPGLLAAASVVFCLTLGELSATLMVAAPGSPTLTMRIYNYLH